MYVFPVPGGPWTTANSLVSANCKAWNCESSSSRSFADGQEAGLKTVTLDTRKRENVSIIVISYFILTIGRSDN